MLKLKKVQRAQRLASWKKKKKKRKTGKSHKQLVAHEEKEVGQPLTIRTWKKTKVESSFFQAPMTSSVHVPLDPLILCLSPP